MFKMPTKFAATVQWKKMFKLLVILVTLRFVHGLCCLFYIYLLFFVRLICQKKLRLIYNTIRVCLLNYKANQPYWKLALAYNYSSLILQSISFDEVLQVIRYFMYVVLVTTHIDIFFYNQFFRYR